MYLAQVGQYAAFCHSYLTVIITIYIQSEGLVLYTMELMYFLRTRSKVPKPKKSKPHRYPKYNIEG